MCIRVRVAKDDQVPDLGIMEWNSSRRGNRRHAKGDSRDGEKVD